MTSIIKQAIKVFFCKCNQKPCINLTEPVAEQVGRSALEGKTFCLKQKPLKKIIPFKKLEL